MTCVFPSYSVFSEARFQPLMQWFSPQKWHQNYRNFVQEIIFRLCDDIGGVMSEKSDTELPPLRHDYDALEPHLVE